LVAGTENPRIMLVNVLVSNDRFRPYRGTKSIIKMYLYLLKLKLQKNAIFSDRLAKAHGN